MQAELITVGCVCADVIARPVDHYPKRGHLELVRDLDGVRYFNDSKGTNIGAAAKAISSLEAPIILIAGGISKGVDFPLSLRLWKRR